MERVQVELGKQNKNGHRIIVRNSVNIFGPPK